MLVYANTFTFESDSGPNQLNTNEKYRSRIVLQATILTKEIDLGTINFSL